MTDHAKRLAEIEARANAATPGPWEGDAHSVVNWHDRTFEMEWIPNGIAPEDSEYGPCNLNSAADGAFMANAREDVPWLLAEHRTASAALTAAGIQADMGTLAERVALLHHDADQQTSLTTRLMSEKQDASEALTAAGIPDDGRGLAERVKALAEKAKPKRCDDCGGTDAPHGHLFGCGMEPEDGAAPRDD